MTKVFLVGSPRSGTTLLQSILTEGGRLYTLKETHFFRHIHRWRPVRLLDKARLDPARVETAFDYIKTNNVLEGEHETGGIVRLDAAVRALDGLLDKEAAIRGAKGWLEKSPEHMFFMNEIRASIEDARFVHILRDGPDVVASLYDAYQRYPAHWGWLGTPWRMVRLYNRYVQTTRANLGRPDTFVVRYDDLVERDTGVMDRLAAFLGMSAGTFTLDGAQSYRPEIVRADEPWKVRGDKGVIDTRGQKFGRLFDLESQARIRRSLATTDDIRSG